MTALTNPRHFTPFYLLHWLSPKQITVDIGGYEQPNGVLDCVSLSFAFRCSNNFYYRRGYKVDKKMAMELSKF